jgi:hypothetical protein
MWNSPLKLVSTTIFTALSLSASTGLAQTSQAPSPSPTPAIPWETKVAAFRDFILHQPNQSASLGFCTGPLLRKTFADNSCLQINLCNYNCQYTLPYKMRGVATWFDSLDLSSSPDPIWDTFRYYQYGYYADPDDEFNFYAQARLTFGACGNRGPQSACGVLYCVDEKGVTVQRACGEGEKGSCVPKGETPYMDPKDRDRVCSWLRGDETSKSV